ncbi:MAG: hypothetical protein KDD47_19890 [Acidobacteria bacterium]|nr:hypothetical protein [Acidobacteriota bacterium]
MTVPETHRLGPRGARPKEHFLRIEPRETLKREGDSLTKTGADGSELRLPPPSAALQEVSVGPGWVEYGSWTDTSEKGILSFSGSWPVPDPPTVDDGQVVFLSMGLQTGENVADDLFLTVLQWGASGAGGGPHWAVACWYQHGGRITYSPLIRVEPGDVISTTIARTIKNPFGTEWTASAKVEGSTRGTTRLPVIGDISLAWAFAALEAYSPAIACDQFPASGQTTFGQLALSSGAGPLDPDWVPTVNFSACNNRVLIPDPSQIDLIYL